METFLERAWPASFHARDLQELLVEHGQQFNKMDGLIQQMTQRQAEQVSGLLFS